MRAAVGYWQVTRGPVSGSIQRQKRPLEAFARGAKVTVPLRGRDGEMLSFAHVTKVALSGRDHVCTPNAPACRWCQRWVGRGSLYE